jgi:hypothetical protein
MLYIAVFTPHSFNSSQNSCTSIFIGVRKKGSYSEDMDLGLPDSDTMYYALGLPVL